MFVEFAIFSGFLLDLTYKDNLFESFSKFVWPSFIARTDYELSQLYSLDGVGWSLGPGSVNEGYGYTGMHISKEWSLLMHSPGPDSSDYDISLLRSFYESQFSELGEARYLELPVSWADSFS